MNELFKKLMKANNHIKIRKNDCHHRSTKEYTHTFRLVMLTKQRWK